MADRNKAIASVKSLTRTIDGLIDREKDKISEHYESQLMSQIKVSNLAKNDHQTLGVDGPQIQNQQNQELQRQDLFGLD